MTSDRRDIHPDVLLRLEQVARHCRNIRLVRSLVRFGWVTFLLTALCTVLLAVASLDSGPVLAGLFVFSELIAFWRCVVRPLREPLTLKRIALFMDKMHPELEDRMSTAVDLGSHGNELASPWIIEQFLEETTPIVRESSAWRATWLEAKHLRNRPENQHFPKRAAQNPAHSTRF